MSILQKGIDIMLKKLEVLYEITGFIKNTSLVTVAMSGLIFLNNQSIKAALLIMCALIVFAVAYISREIIVDKALPLYEAEPENHYGYALKN